MALILCGMLLSNTTLSYYTNQLRATVFHFGNKQWNTPKIVEKRMLLKQSKENASTSARIINHELQHLPMTFTMNSMTEISTTAEKLIRENEQELKESEKVIEELKAKHMQELQPELRPPEFPEHLWQLVFDSEKVKVGQRFATLREHRPYDTDQLMENRTEESDPVDLTKLPKNRLEEILARLKKIDISTESPARLAEKDFCLAQCLAHIDRFGHPNPNQPAKAKADIFTINLVDKLLPPCFRKSKRLANMAYWSLRRRVEYMLLRGEIRESNSPWNSPPMMVPQADKIQSFMTKHGEKAMDRLAMSEYAEEVRVLYRFTVPVIFDA
jgi:hypothetical protein